MKSFKIIAAFIAAITVIFCLSFTSSPGNDNVKYEIKSGIVTYKGELAGLSIPITLYFDDYGRKEYNEVALKMNIPDSVLTSRTATLTVDGYSYSLDLNLRTAVKTKVSAEAVKTPIAFGNLSKKEMQKMGLKKEGKKKLLGLDCTLYSIENDSLQMKGSIAVYKGVPLVMDLELMGMPFLMEATAIEVNPVIPAERFMIPEDITPVEE